MNRAIIKGVVMVILTFPLSGASSDYVAGQQDAQVLKLLREMSQSLPLRTTTLKEVAPHLLSEKKKALTWSQAVSEADSRFGKRQPDRALFLRKYVSAGLPVSELAKFQLRESGASVRTGVGRSLHLVVGSYEMPIATIGFWISGEGLRGDATVSIPRIEWKGADYVHLTFDTNDTLLSANRRVPGHGSGGAIYIGQNTSGTGGVNFYSAQITGKNGETESLHYSPELVITERSVGLPGKTELREVFENGELRERIFYKRQQTEHGTESVIDRRVKVDKPGR